MNLTDIYEQVIIWEFRCPECGTPEADLWGSGPEPLRICPRCEIPGAAYDVIRREFLRDEKGRLIFEE